MYYDTIITTTDLKSLLKKSSCRVINCHFDLSDTEEGQRLHALEHIPGALYAHLDIDLSGAIVSNETGRHPLPCVTVMEALFSKWGIGADTQVVVYDDKKGAVASRLWWMLRYCGHKKVAVLDGGWSKWKKESLPVSKEEVKVRPTAFKASLQTNFILEAKEVERWSTLQDKRVVDSRTNSRYRGEMEPIDPIAGHIPGAINMPFPDNWTAEGVMKPIKELKECFARLPDVENTVFYCGSGVTACYNLLAIAHAELGNARLYPGSWSHWITDSNRQISKEI